MATESQGVRPTRRCLADLGLDVPDIGVWLDELDDPVVTSAQAVPEQRDAGGAQRVLSLTDRVWFKVKTSDRRAVVTELQGEDRPSGLPDGVGSWWIGAAGRRQADSPQKDFYDSIKRECTTGRTVSTDGLLPRDWDWKRLTIEQAFAWRREMKRLVLHLIAESLRTGHLMVADLQDHRIKALVRADNGHEGYLAIFAEGIPNPEMFALLLDCVPGVAPDDWQPEPSDIAELQPSLGEIVWSTLLPPEVASAILEASHGA
jgi:hypothetical protein